MNWCGNEFKGVLRIDFYIRVNSVEFDLDVDGNKSVRKVKDSNLDIKGNKIIRKVEDNSLDVEGNKIVRKVEDDSWDDSL